MIEIGATDGELQIDLGRLVSGCALVQGKRGTGKSYLVRVIIEQAIPAGVQVIVLDPEGEFSTLREKCDVLIAGPRGDLPVEPASAKLLARRIAELGCSAVLDMSDLDLEEQREFVREVLTGLDRLPRELERSRLIVIDEAHQFAPEQGKDTSAASKAMIALMSRGRKRGLGAILVTQRLAKLRKDASAEVEYYFIFGTAPVDLQRAREVLGLGKEELQQMRGMPRGTCYAHVESENVSKRVKVRHAATTHPEPGMRHKVVPPPPKRALQKLIAELATSQPSPAVDVVGDDLAVVRLRRIHELERQLAARPAAAPAAPARTVTVTVIDEAAIAAAVDQVNVRWRAWAFAFVEKLGKAAGQLGGAIDMALAQVGDLDFKAKLPKKTRKATVEPEPKIVNGAAKSERVSQPAASSAEPGASHERAFVGKAYEMLKVLAQHGELTRVQLGMLVGASAKGGTFGRYVSAGKALGYWEVDGKTMRITAAGYARAAELGGIELMPAPGKPRLEHWCAQKALQGKVRDMLRVVASAGQDGIDREALAGAIDLEGGGGTFGRYLSTLRSLKLVTGKRVLVAAPEIRP